MTANPSLLRFVLARLEEETEMILLNTPVVVPDDVHLDDALRELLGNRDKLLQRVAGTKDIVIQTADAMGQEQELIEIPGAAYPPVTILGSFILKTIAARYADHPDYHSDWEVP